MYSSGCSGITFSSSGTGLGSAFLVIFLAGIDVDGSARLEIDAR